MDWTLQLQNFIQEHLNDATDRLLLSAHRYPDVDVAEAVAQIEARRQLRQKLPEWYALPGLIMGGRVPAEQCSSELTARYKQRLVEGDTLADLTGGMGVDLYYMSRGVRAAYYVERQPELCAAARHNFPALGADNITVREGDGLEALADVRVDTLYLDPARRAADGGRVYDLADCEPDVVAHRRQLLVHCRRLVVKISPMADLTRVLQSMPGTVEVHILAVRGECKEVILVLSAAAGLEAEAMTPEALASVQISCTDFRATDTLSYTYRWADEVAAHSRFAAAMGDYLYEPDVTLLKAGAFRSLGQRFGLDKLEVNSHLYTSATLAADFPGRIFGVEEVLPFASRTLKQLRRAIPQANITARNFPLTADQLRARTGIRDGGEVYLFGTTLQGVGPILLKCHKR
jgi:hypothetical protein